MNKISLMNIAVVLLIVVSAGALVYFFLTEKPPAPADETQPGDAGAQPAPTTSSKVASVCDELGLPEGSYLFEEGACIPTEAHQALVIGLAREEYEAGDEHQLVYIKNVYQKSGDVYIDADSVRWLSHSDGSCFLPGDASQPAKDDQSVPECNPNGFLIVNDDPAVQSFKLSSDVKVRLLEEFGNIPDLRALSPQEFTGGGRKLYVYEGEDIEEPFYTPFRLILKHGEVIFVHQVYVP